MMRIPGVSLALALTLALAGSLSAQSAYRVALCLDAGAALTALRDSDDADEGRVDSAAADVAQACAAALDTASPGNASAEDLEKARVFLVEGLIATDRWHEAARAWVGVDSAAAAGASESVTGRAWVLRWLRNVNERWNVFYADSSRFLVMDRENQEGLQGPPRGWVMWHRAEPDRLPSGETYQISRNLYAADCEGRRLRSLSASYLSRNGALVGGRATAAAWMHVAPETLGELILKRLCRQ